MAGGPVAVVSRAHIRDRVVAGLTLPGGMVFRWTAGLRRVADLMIKEEIPVRTGALRASYYSFVRANKYASTLRVGVTAPHADYVLFGTGPIVGNMILYAGVKMGWRPASAAVGRTGNYTSYIGLTADVVQGQRANDFLTRGVTRTVRYAIRG